MSAAMSMSDHQTPGGSRDQHGAMPDCCVMGACAFMTPVATAHAMVITPSGYAQVALPASDDAFLPSLSISPDLRPPIA
jgi:hypothetical protein